MASSNHQRHLRKNVALTCVIALDDDVHMSTPVTFSVVLPCFNEEENVLETVGGVLSWFAAESIKGEIIAVDDGSKDRTHELLLSLAKSSPVLKVMHHDVNQGYGAAIRTGCDAAIMDVIGFMDSDGQFRPEDFKILLPYIQEYAFVTGRRRRRADSFVRGMLGKVLGLMNWIVLGLWVRDVNCGMKIFRRETWPLIRPTKGFEKLFNTEMFLHLKLRKIPWMQVDVPHYPRRAGNPTGAKFYVIIRMFKELRGLRQLVTRSS